MLTGVPVNAVEYHGYGQVAHATKRRRQSCLAPVSARTATHLRAKSRTPTIIPCCLGQQTAA